MTDRIVIHPEGLRLMASRMRGTAELLSATGRDLEHRHLPAMPAAVASVVTESLARANRELQDLSAALVREGGLLSVRATWAEMGEREPGWRGVGAFGEPGSSPAATDTERWSVAVIEGAEEPMQAAVGDDSTRLREMVGGTVEPGGSGEGLGDPLFEVGIHAPDVAVADTPAGRLASGAALGNVLSETGSGPTGAGILGCIAVGLGSAETGGGS